MCFAYLKNRTKLNPETGCWEWQYSTDLAGYGFVCHRFWGSIKAYSHRLMYITLHGDIPNDKVIMHKCDNPKCCNPEHLSIGTQKENETLLKALKSI